MENKALFATRTKANENKVLYFEALSYKQNIIKGTIKTLVSIMTNLQTHYYLKLDFQNVDQHTGGKLIHGTKHHKDNQLQSLELRCRIS